MAERDYQTKLIRKIKRSYPGTIAIKNDSGYQQGIPDWSLFFADGFTAVLEVKDSSTAKEQPNQQWFIDRFNAMGFFSAIICPENEKEVLAALQQAFKSRGNACVPVA